MLQGFLTAIALFMSLIMEQTVISALPSPWQSLAIPLFVGIVIMYRISLPLGSLFLISAAVLSYADGLSNINTLVAYGVTTLVAIAVFNRVFAKRSLAAMAGFAVATTFTFALVRLLYALLYAVERSEPVLVGVLILHLLFSVFAGVTIVIGFSLAYSKLHDTFGKRFMQKNASYEVRGI